MKIVDQDKALNGDVIVGCHDEQHSLKHPPDQLINKELRGGNIEYLRKRAEQGLSLFDDYVDPLEQEIIDYIRKNRPKKMQYVKVFGSESVDALYIVKKLKRDGVITYENHKGWSVTDKEG